MNDDIRKNYAGLPVMVLTLAASGSVAGGGILRRLVTVEVEPVVADPSSPK